MSRDRAERFVQLPVQCPECGKREARRSAAWRLELYRDADPQRVVETIRCKCRTLYGIRASVYQAALESEPRPRP